MRRLIAGGAFLVSAASAFSPAAFVPGAQPTSIAEINSRRTLCFSSITKDTDCGCDSATTISGAPSEQARLVNPIEALSKSTVFSLDGRQTPVSDLLTNGVNLVVLTRSFG